MADILELFRKIASERAKKTPGISFIVVGLGNYGDRYERTRHNAGFLAMDRVAERFGCHVNRRRFDALTGECAVDGKGILLMKPLTYMNLSGRAVRAAADYYGIGPESILVISDDVSIAPGRMRIRKKGSAGSHNGLEDIIEELDSEDFPRIRIGVGDRPDRAYDLKDWVLGKFSERDLETLDPVFSAVAEASEMIICGKIDEAMGKFNGMRSGAEQTPVPDAPDDKAQNGQER